MGQARQFPVLPLTLSVVFAGLASAGAQASVPLGPVPFVLSDFVILLSGLILGPLFGSLSVAIYLMTGALGLPVFADGHSGWDHFTGPTGGYLVGFLAAGLVVGLISHRGRWQVWWLAPKLKVPVWRDLLAVLGGYILIYASGVIGLKWHSDLDWGNAFVSGCWEFRIPMIIKSSSAILIAQVVRWGSN